MIEEIEEMAEEVVDASDWLYDVEGFDAKIEPVKVKDIVKALTITETDKPVDQQLIIASLMEALEKSYIRFIDAPDAKVKAMIDAKGVYLHLYHGLLVVEEDSGYEELEITLEDALKRNPTVKVGDYLAKEVAIKGLGRATVGQIKNILKQKVRESEKQAIYDEYIDQKGELVTGFIESVEEKFVIVNLGKTLALMPKSQQIPNEIYKEGEKIKVLITKVEKNSKGAQVLVSRSDATLVKRLFEKEVTELFQGIVEIKAIAREAGDRTKMAVYSKNDDVDPIGACIGPRGQRIQAIIEELKGEKVDVFLWSDNIGELIKNALSPAEVIAYYWDDEHKGVVAVVDDDKLSLAIGKKGKNARLAVKLVGKKIDIKTRSEVAEEGVDYYAKTAEFVKEYHEMQKEKEAEKFKALQEEMAKKRAELEISEEDHNDQLIASVFEDEEDEIIEVTTPVVEKEEPVVEPVVETVVEEAPKPKEEKIKANLENLKANASYVSKYENVQEEKKEVVKKKKSTKKVDEDRKLKPSELKKDKESQFKIEYSEEELDEIDAYDEEIEANSWIEDDEIDFDEYDSYYDEEN